MKKPTRSKRRTKPSRPAKPRATVKSGSLTRRIAELLAEREAGRRREARARRAADRRLAAIVQEIATLRHHEARAEALTRLLAERDSTLAAQAERIAELEHLLRRPTQLG